MASKAHSSILYAVSWYTVDDLLRRTYSLLQPLQQRPQSTSVTTADLRPQRNVGQADLVLALSGALHGLNMRYGHERVAVDAQQAVGEFFFQVF